MDSISFVNGEILTINERERGEKVGICIHRDLQSHLLSLAISLKQGLSFHEAAYACSTLSLVLVTV